jgi:hypothetical protein
MLLIRKAFVPVALLLLTTACLAQAPKSKSKHPDGGATAKGSPCLFNGERGVVPDCIHKTATGKLFVASRYVKELDFDSSGLAPVRSEGPPYGWVYVNRKGEAVITDVPTYDNGADDFSEGLVRIVRNGKVGFADRQGKIVIPPVYDWAWPFDHGAALACNGCREKCAGDCEHQWMEGGEWFHINRKGQVLPKPAAEAPAKDDHSVTITFPPDDHRGEPDAEIARRFDVPWDACTRGVIAQATDAETADACEKAAAIADEFPPDRRFKERRLAYVYAAGAFANIRDLKTALQYAEKAVKLVKLGHDDNAGNNAAYFIRGRLRAFSGDLAGGDKDLSIAEDFCRRGQLSGALRQDLLFHAELLKRMNRPQEAQAKLDEAAKL